MPLTHAILSRRINRFVAEIILDNKKIRVYVPNTGRLSELALPGTRVLLSPLNTKFRYKILYIMKDAFPVMIDSSYSNTLFHELLENGSVPGLEHAQLVKREPVYTNHRFDFLVKDKRDSCYIELKSCTLFHKDTASFPDAVSSRASEHVKILAETGCGMLMFLILHDAMKRFVPNYHTDFLFYETLKKYRENIEIMACTIQYDDDLKIRALLPVPVIIPEVSPRGIIFLVLHSTGRLFFSGTAINPGYYICLYKNDKNIFKTISSLKRKNGLGLILPEKISSSMKIISDIPVITDSLSTEYVKEKLTVCGGREISLPENIPAETGNAVLYFKDNPVDEKWFWNTILEMRFGIYSDR